MPHYYIKDIVQYYENFNVKVDNKWYFVTKDKLFDIIKRYGIDGEIVQKRTKEWII